jgi:hypothetical protein
MRTCTNSLRKRGGGAKQQIDTEEYCQDEGSLHLHLERFHGFFSCRGNLWGEQPQNPKGYVLQSGEAKDFCVLRPLVVTHMRDTVHPNTRS